MDINLITLMGECQINALIEVSQFLIAMFDNN